LASNDSDPLPFWVFPWASSISKVFTLIQWKNQYLSNSWERCLYVTSDPSVKSKAMNMVIKLTMIDGICVVKLSDSPGKAMGDPKMVEIMKYLHFKN
jgi:hypothetical protein